MVIQLFPEKTQSREFTRAANLPHAPEVERFIMSQLKPKSHSDTEDINSKVRHTKLGSSLTESQCESLAIKMLTFSLTFKDVRHLHLADCLEIGPNSVDIRAEKREYIAGLVLALVAFFLCAFFTVLAFNYPAPVEPHPFSVVVLVVFALLYFASVRWYFVQPWWIVNRALDQVRQR